jgi:hypothetical protein
MIGDHIQEKISNGDIVIYPLYPYISLYIFTKDIHIHICQSYPINILHILFFQVHYPGNISLMISSYGVLSLSNYIHFYPMNLSVSYILHVILFGYPVPLTVILSYLISYPFISYQLFSDIVQTYIRGDATRMETYIELGALAYKHRSCRGIFTQQLLTPQCYSGLPDDTRIDSSPNTSNQKIQLLVVHLADLEFGGDRYSMPECTTHTYT